MQGDYFPFVYCVEKLTFEGKYTEWETCFDKLNLDSKPVKNCSSSGFGHEVSLLGYCMLPIYCLSRDSYFLDL